MVGSLTYKVNHQSLLREVTYDPRLGVLCFAPLPDLALLRRGVRPLAEINSSTAVPSGGGPRPDGTLALPTPPNVANQSEIRVTFAMPTKAVTFGVRVMTARDAAPTKQRGMFSQGFAFSVGFTPAPPDGKPWAVDVGENPDRHTLKPAGSTVTQMPLLPGVDTTMELVIYVDHTVVQAFFQGGRVAIVDHLPPNLFLAVGNNTVQGVEIFASDTGVTVLNATVWAMDNAFPDVRTHGRPNWRPPS